MVARLAVVVVVVVVAEGEGGRRGWRREWEGSYGGGGDWVMVDQRWYGCGGDKWVGGGGERNRGKGEGNKEIEINCVKV